jgi:protein-tyrosine phosphatase
MGEDGSVQSSARPGDPIPVPSVPNLRDLGGWATLDGRTVRRGRILRSVDLSRLQDDDVPALADLGLRTLIDLRTPQERAAAPDRSVPGIRRVVDLDVLGESLGSLAAHMAEVLTQPDRAPELLHGRRAQDLFVETYRDMVSSPGARRAYRGLVLEVLAADGPVLVHCTTGKDRTGWAAASLLLLLGVDAEQVMAEYLLTNAQLLPALEPLFARFAAGGGDPALLRPVLGVQPDYLLAALEEMAGRYGSVEGYFGDGLGIDAAQQGALRDRLLA